MKRTILAAGFAVFTLAMGLCSLPFQATAQAAPPVATFDWFEYSGNDAIFARPRPEGTYQNPILAGYYPDPSIVRVGDDYYLINSTFAFYPGIPVFHSTDLVNWRQIGNAIDRPDMMPFDNLHLGYNGVYAPAIEYKDGTFYIINTCVGCGGNFVITSKDPAGPWSDPIWLPHIGGIDPSIFFDDDGKVYVVHHRDPVDKKYDAHTAVWIMEVDPVTFAPRSEDIMLVDGATPQPWHREYIEGPHIYKVKGKYILSFPGGGTGYYHGQLAYRADIPFGPYEANPNNPILTQFGLPDDRPDPVTATGHGDMVEDQNGQWWMVFLGTRPYDLSKPPQDPGRFHTGRETFLLPVTWTEDGWPVVLDKGTAVPLNPLKPNLPASQPQTVPITGNFTYRDDFDGDKLALQWLFVRTPHETWWKTNDGKLTLQAHADRLATNGQPSFIGRRVQHMNATTTTQMTFVPKSAGEEAGIMAVQNNEHFYAFGRGVNDKGEQVLRVRKRQGSNDPATGVVLAEKALTTSAGQPVWLKVHLDKGEISFAYSADGKTYTSVLDKADSQTLTTATAGGFTGAVIGMYAEGN